MLESAAIPPGWVTHPWVAGSTADVRFGVADGPLGDWPARSEFVSALEALGFDSFWSSDHPVPLAGCWTILAGLVASPHAMNPSLHPLPCPEDRTSADAMAAGSVTMTRMAQVIDEAATLLLPANDPQPVDLGRHWALDAQALRQQAAWMVLSVTAADMIDAPAITHEVNARSLKGNGLAMTAEGQAMATVETSAIDAIFAPDVAGHPAHRSLVLSDGRTLCP